MTISTELNRATPTNFEMVFPLLPPQTGIEANKEFTLNIHGAILPAVSIPNEIAGWQNSVHKVAGGPVDFEIMNVMFLVDAQFKNWKLLWNWMAYIANGRDKMAENHSKFAVDSSIIITDNFGGNVLSVDFKGMWPTNIQEVSFSYKEGEVLLESSVTFVYDYFTVNDNL
jgi:hypothetical protein